MTLKIYTLDEDNKEDFHIYKQLNQGSSWHPGHPYIRKALDIFTIPSSGRNYSCLVQTPMWESFQDLLYRNSNHRFTEELLKAGLMQIFLALDYLHTECKLVHTGNTYQQDFINMRYPNLHYYRHQKRQYSPGNRRQVYS